MKNNLLYLIISIFFIPIFKLGAQSHPTFEKLSSDNDVNQSIVYAIGQDKYANLWLATEEGVVRNDSKDSYIYNKYNGLPEGVTDRVSVLFVDSKNRIWIGTQNGLCLFDRKKDEFQLISKKHHVGFNVTNIIEDNYGQIWINANNTLFKCTEKNKEYHLTKILHSITSNICSINSSIVYSKNNYLFSLDINSRKSSVIKKITSNSSSIILIKVLNNEIFIGMSNGEVYKTNVYFDSFFNVLPAFKSINIPIKDIELYHNKYYIATDGAGVIVLNKDFKKIAHFMHNEDIPDSLSSDGVYDLFRDDQGLLWIATYGGGVNYINPLKNNFIILKHQLNNKNSLSNNFCRSFLDVGNNIIWFGTKNGINVWDRNNNSWKHISSIENNTKGAIILSMVLDGDFVWAGSYNKGLLKINKKTLSVENYGKNENKKVYFNNIYKVFKDNANNKWIGGINGFLTKITNKNKIFIYKINQIKDIIQRRNGDIITVGKNGVFKINKAGQIIEIKKLHSKKGYLEYVTINCLIENKYNNLILGTNGAGLILFNPQNNKLKLINSESGLPSDIIQGIVEINPKEYWISTTKGLAKIKIDKNNISIVKYEKSDGISSNEYNFNAYAKLNSGEILFGGVDGVTLFDPKMITKQNYLPKIIFEEFLIFNELVTPKDKILNSHINEKNEINLKYTQNSIGLKFVGVVHGFASKVKYTWKLDGFDKKWSLPNGKTRVNYTNLNYGDYIFRVKASNKDGVWGKERILHIKIERPWWASFLAYLIYLLIFGLCIYGVIYIATLLQVKKSKEEQINTLNNITHEIKTPLSILIASIENDSSLKDRFEIKSTIERLNLLISQMLNFHLVSSKDNVPIEISEIILDDYFNELIINFNPLLSEKNLKIILKNNYEKEVFYYEKESFDKIILNLISNAVKYSKDNSEIKISLYHKKKNQLGIKITDKGIGIPKDQQKYILNNFYRARNVINSRYSGTGLGLMIVKNLVEKNNGKITFESKENIGTTFKIELIDQESKFLSSNIIKDFTISPSFDVNELNKFNNYKILVVEDNEILRRNMVRFLENYFLVYEAKNGKEGLDLALQIFPNLILTDFMMPEMDGVEMCNILKENINLNHIPVFMMTVLNNTLHKQSTIESGITEYFEKPIDINLLLAKINNIFNWQEKLKEKYLLQEEINNADKFKSKKNTDFILKLESIILDKIQDENFSLQDICSLIGMSRTSLYMKLKSLIDLSPQDFIIHTKLKYARKLLTEGDVNIKEVAYASGFSNPKYFSTSFKKFFGITPTSFIESLNKK